MLAEASIRGPMRCGAPCPAGWPRF